MLFLKMNYNLIYNTIILAAKSKNRTKNKIVYYENHHIIPKCMGGTNDKHNKVLLTFKEHFICHKLLYEMYKNTPYSYKLMYALHRMYLKGNTERKIHSGKFYEEVKTKFCKQQSENGKKRVGKKHTEETKQKISKIHKGKKLSEKHIEIIKEYQKSIKDIKSKIAKDNHAKGLYSSEKIKKLWQNKEFRENISNKIKENYKNNPHLKKEISKRIKEFRKNNPAFLPIAKKVYYKDKIFLSMKEASEHANMKYPTFVWNLKNNKNFQYSLKAFNL